MGVNHLYGVIFLALVGVAGCAKHNPAVCEADGDCTDTTRPFCDVNGEYPESNHTPGECTVTPANCPVARCGCTPGQTLSCANDTATVCASDGMSTTQQSCALGCSSQQTRCATFTPSNGLADALSASASESDVAVPAGSHIDTDLGIIQNSSGSSIQVKTTIVTQPGQPSIRVFEANTFLIDDAVVSGSNAVAFVAPGSITIRGHLKLGANGEQAGPGGQESPAVCVGTTAVEANCGLLSQDSGAGGGGNATIGGSGGTTNSTIAGGAPVPTFTPLVGGCRGGNVQIDLQSTVIAHGGGGGGAMQLVSLTSVDITGAIDLAGGGGEGGHGANDTSGGGGSGGLLILEAPVVSVRGPDGITANGGAAGGCGVPGSNGTTTTSQATNPSCSGPGLGGTGSLAPTSGYSCFNTGTVTCVCGGYYYGGGGAAGRIHVVTKGGAITTTQSPTISAQVTSASLVIN